MSTEEFDQALEVSNEIQAAVEFETLDIYQPGREITADDFGL